MPCSTVLPKLPSSRLPSSDQDTPLVEDGAAPPQGSLSGTPKLSSSRGRQRVHSKPIEKPMMPPVKEPKHKDPQPSSSEPKLDLQPEPTVKFLFTLLSEVEPPEPKDPEEDWETQESRFLDKQDWGAQQTSKEISCLQNACMRLRESLNTIQADNLALGQKLENLPNLLYRKLKKEVQAIQEEGKPVQEGAQDIQERALIQVLRQPCGEW